MQPSLKQKDLRLAVNIVKESGGRDTVGRISLPDMSNAYTDQQMRAGFELLQRHYKVPSVRQAPQAQLVMICEQDIEP